MTGRRMQFTYGNVSIFADRLRMSSYMLFGRFHLALAPAADVETEQEPVSIDLPKQDAAAYRRAIDAFNAVMDEHERVIAARNARRRAQAGANQSHPFAAVPAAALLDQ